jgi:GDP-L-fucose synthase
LSGFENPEPVSVPETLIPIERYSGKKVLVAGGTGMIGRPLVSLLESVGAEVTVAGIEPSVAVESFFSNQVVYKQADFTDAKVAQQACEGKDFVFNLVGIKGSVGVGESRAASVLVPMLRFQTNLLEASWLSGVEGFLFVSSINVYPPSSLHAEQNAWAGAPMQSDRITAIGKRVGEVLGLAFQLEHNWDAMKIVRPANVYGPYDIVDPIRSQVIPALIRKFLSGGDSVQVWGSGSTVRDFVYSDDVAYWIAKGMLNLPTNYPVNIGGGRGVTVAELAEAIALATGFSGRIEFDPSKPSGDPVRLLDTTRARQFLDYEVRTSLDVGLRKTVEWMRGVV